MEKKYEYQLKEFQAHYERLLQSKIQEVEDEAITHLNSMKDCEKEYQLIMDAKTDDYDNNYVTRKESEAKLRERQQLIDKQLTSIHEKELDFKDLEFKITILEDKKGQVERELRNREEKLVEYEQILKEEKSRRKAVEIQVESTKGENRKYRKLMSEFEDKMKAFSA